MKPTVLIVIGITGDLNKRFLLPALGQIIKTKHTPKQFKIIGVTRRSITENEILDDLQSETSQAITENLEIYQMDLGAPADYKKLEQYLDDIDKEFGGKAQRLFYMSVPPRAVAPIIKQMGQAGLNDPRVKLLLEKPFGTDLASAENLVEQAQQHYSEEQIYRIDHFLAKEMAQNLLVFRERNSLFRNTWNNQFICKIEIVASEKIGIEGRVVFYEQTGALRDLIQSHLLQLAALVLMDIPSSDDNKDVPARRLDALKDLKIPDGPIEKYAKRGQYKGYKDEVKNPNSFVETLASITLESSDPRWRGVPIVASTGKSLVNKSYEIRIHYRRASDQEANQLILRLQPNEGLEIDLWTKKPGYNNEVEKRDLDFTYSEHYSDLPEPYEQVLLDAINSEHRLFPSSAEVLESWRIIDPIQKNWLTSAADLIYYKPGSKLLDLL